ncbi:FAD-binding oxidoreductase [Phragmitibacter flavus]|uniref:FAD-binding oxidoreductase n=1 Tax=Phragmitibacter flavus TaxID=2576071 RepID=A0A5R8KJU6_9BACT|nr:FAD-dependent oxidoreductase [Phragmitibacter flavus]TLD72530.1 FAD-binding oxidoreductase [Phragmitibacter flavus]
MNDSHFDVIIIGSGICGTSTAFHLKQRGAGRVLVLEQGAICSGTTSHAPGLVGQLRADPALMRLLRESVAFYAEHGDGGYQAVGSLRLAASEARWREILKQKAQADEAGLACELLSTEQALEKFPYFDAESVQGALWVPEDGSADAVALTLAIRTRALEAGVEFRAQSRVTAFGEGSVRVGDDDEWLFAPVIVMATGVWSWPLAELAGVYLPVVPMQHQVVWSEDLPWLDEDRPLPNLRDPDGLVYFRQKGRQLVLGGYERDPRAFDPRSIRAGVAKPTEQVFDAEHFESLLTNGKVRVPALRDKAMKWSRTLNGIESFTPDGHFLLGPFPQKKGLWAACGFCAHGVSGSGGVGRFMADWISDGRPSMPVPGMEVARYQEAHERMTFDEAVESVTAIYSTYYDIDKSV